MSEAVAAGVGFPGEVEERARAFSIHDPAIKDNPYPVLAEMQEKCPVARSEQLGGYWFVTSYEGVRSVLSDPETFSTRILQLPPPEEHPVMIPESFDPPIHTAYRQVMAPLFSPPAIAAMEESIRSRARLLLEEFARAGGGDFVEKVATRLPASVILQILGLPLDDLSLLLRFRDAFIRGITNNDPAVAEHAINVVLPETSEYFAKAIAARRASADTPSDLISLMVTGDLRLDGGRHMTDEEIINALYLLVAAGLDTVAATISKSVATLAARQDLREQLVDDPGLVPMAAEEFLRYWSLISTCRQATVDTVLQGKTIRSGDIVSVCTPAASRDPKEFPNPEVIDFHRIPNRHLAFGAGPHRCIGSHLARAELKVFLQALIEVMPRFESDPEHPPEYHFGQVIGVDHLMLKVPV